MSLGGFYDWSDEEDTDEEAERAASASEMMEERMMYKIGDRVRVQSATFVRNTSVPYEDEHYQFIGNSTDDLIWNVKMFQYCDQLATITYVHSRLGHYRLDISKSKHYWSPEMLHGINEFGEFDGFNGDQKKMSGQFGLNTLEFSEELL